MARLGIIGVGNMGGPMASDATSSPRQASDNAQQEVTLSILKCCQRQVMLTALRPGISYGNRGRHAHSKLRRRAEGPTKTKLPAGTSPGEREDALSCKQTPNG